MSAASSPDTPEREPTRILVVDDGHDAADSLRELLCLLGYEAQAVYDGFEALQRVASFRPDVVLLDIGMPGIDGYEVARRLRALRGFQEVLLVAVTAYGEKLDRVLSVLAGIDHHLVKPVDTEVLIGLIKSHLARRSQVRRGHGEGNPADGEE